MGPKDDYNFACLQELLGLYSPVKQQIEDRLEEFKQVWEKGSDKVLFEEMVFCLLTPQSRAKICWAAVQRLAEKCRIDRGDADQIQIELTGVRFSQKKAGYICLAMTMFPDSQLRKTLSGFNSPFAAREWLVENVKGFGYKEASHFLRNIGLGEDLAILDRHILKNLKLLRVINEVPASLSRKTYLEIEKKMRAFSEQAGIPMGHLDLLLWYKEAGEVFK